MSPTPGVTPRANSPEGLASLSELRGLTRLSDLGIGDARVTGTRATQEFFLPGPGDFPLGENSTLTIELSHSNLLVPDRSTVNVVMNGRPLRSIYLDQTNVKGSAYVIPLPKDVIRKDFNRLQLEYAMTLGQECEDPNNPSLYAVLFATTQLQLDFAEQPPVPVLEPPSLATYPYPFFRAGYPVVAPVTIVIPNDPTGLELTAAYRVAADMASRVSFELARLEVKQLKDVPARELTEHQLILIGSPVRLPLVREVLTASSVSVGGDSELRRANAPLPQAHGVLVIAESPWNRRLRALAITGATEQALARDVDALTNPESTALFAGPETILTEPVSVELGGTQFLQQFTFRQVGAADRSITATDTFTLTFTAPQVAAGTTGQIDLVVSTPEVLDRRRSNIVVELNGQQVQTIELKETQTRRASYRVRIPSDALRTGPNQLTFRTSLYTQDSANYGPCASAAVERVWAIIHNDSAISLPQVVDQATISTGSTLASLPFPFAGLMGLQDTTFVVDPANPASLRGGMLAAVALGRRAGARGRFDVQSAASATPQSVGDRHVVAVGIPPESTIAREVEPVLPLVFGPEGSRALVAEDAKLTEILDASRLGALQMAPVPWARSRRLLVASGSDNEALEWVTEALPRRGFEGNVALVQSPTVVTTFSLARLSEEEVERQLRERFTERESLMMQLSAYALVAGGAVFMLLAWSLRDRVRPRLQR